MATNGRGQLRPHSANRSPPYIFVGLFVVIAILGFNYWNVSSKHTMLRRELDRSVDDVKRYEMKKLSLEKINANLLDTVKKNEAETKQINDELKVNKDQLQLKSSEYEKLKSENDQLKQEMDGTRQEVQASAQYLLNCQNNLTTQMEQFKVLRDEYAAKLEELKGQNSNCESQCKQMMSDVHQKILRYVQKVLGDKAIIALQQQGLDVSGITLTPVQPGTGTQIQPQNPAGAQSYQTQNQGGVVGNQQQQGTVGNQNPADQGQGQYQQVQGQPQNPASSTQTQQDNVSAQNQPQAQGQGDQGQQAGQGQQGQVQPQQQGDNQPQSPVNVQSPPVVFTNQVGLGPMGNVQQNQSKGQETTEATTNRNFSNLAANEKPVQNETANQPSATVNDQQKLSNQIPQQNSSKQILVAEHVTSNNESTVTQSPSMSQANLRSKFREDSQPKAVEPEEEDGKDAEEDEDEAELKLPKESRQAPSRKQRGQMNLDEDTEVIGEGQQGQGQEEGQEEGQDGNGNRDYVGQQQEDQANQKLRFDPVVPAKEVIAEQNSIDRMGQGEQPQAREEDAEVAGLS